MGLDMLVHKNKTLKHMTQRGIQMSSHLTNQQCMSTLLKPHLVVLMMYGNNLYTDVTFAKVHSLALWSNTCVHVCTEGLSYSLFYPLKSKREVLTTIWKMVHDFFMAYLRSLF